MAPCSFLEFIRNRMAEVRTDDEGNIMAVNDLFASFTWNSMIQARISPKRNDSQHGSKGRRLPALVLPLALAWLVAGCGSDSSKQAAPSPASGNDGTGAAAEPDGPDASPSPSPGGADTPAALGGLYLPSGDPGPATLHRLTRSEFVNSLRDLLGADVPIGELEPDVLVGGFSAIGASSVAVSPAGVGLHEKEVLDATGFVFADEARVSALFPCVPADAADSECMSRIVSQFGRRAFRRPLTEDEVQRFAGLAATIGSSAGALPGVRYALAAILQSPSFIYRVELGEASAADGGRSKYTNFEMASRLAGTLWDSVPDDTLLDAAEAGSLATPDGVKAEAERLLADPKAERAIAVFTTELFAVSHLDQAEKDDTMFPAWRESLKEAMREELERRVLDMVFVQKGDFLSLYDDRKTFVNDDLAEFYGLPLSGQPGFHPAEFPPESKRAGLLGAGAVLAGHGLPQRNSPTARGKFVSEMLLCRNIPPPPNNVPPLPPQAGPDVTMRERLAVHRQAAVCASCHSMMDPIGFGMEDFDSVGLHRTMEGTVPVDASGSLEGPGLDGSTFEGLAELGAALRRQPVVVPCLVSKIYSEALGRRAVRGDTASIEELSSSFSQGQNRLDQLLVTLVTSESFRFAEPKGVAQ
jgi:hypothetical protein